MLTGDAECEDPVLDGLDQVERESAPRSKPL
jgi:hypothetical protein